jgi:hypothetical protein
MFKSAYSLCLLLPMLISAHNSQAQSAAVLIAKKSLWKYEASGTDLGAAWKEAGFNDGNWPSGNGILGFGENYINTALPAGYMTYYFRKPFTLAVAPALMTHLTLMVNYDDGFVAYLNGQEIARRALPAGVIAFGTPASNHEGGIYEAIDLTPHINKLVMGKNVLAIQVHQNNDQSSDVVMDVELNYHSNPINAGVIRGPYLQLGTPSSMVIRWRTDVATNSRVRYGTDPNNLSMMADDLAAATDHIVKLSKLAPATKYYYTVGTTSGVLANGADFYFTTNPPPGATKKTRVWVLGDAGTTTFAQRQVRDAYYHFAGSTPTDLWVMLGDNAYSSGTDAEYQAALFDSYTTMLKKSVLWPAFGDRDALSAASPTQSGVYYDIFTLPTQAEAGGVASETEAYYSFDYANIHFVCLNSQDLPRSVNGAMLTWLQKDLAANKKPWTIAFWHHSPYSKSLYDSDKETQLIEMRRNALPILENGGVDLVLTGHSHSYERSFLLDGHYGPSGTLTTAMIRNSGDGRVDGDGAYLKTAYAPIGHQGTVYLVAGSAGEVGNAPLNHPAMRFSLKALGSVVIDVDSNRADVKFLDDQAGIRDYFTMIKSEKSNPPPAAPSNLTAKITSSSAISLAWKDNSNNEEGFKIERRTGNGSFSAVAALGPDMTSYLDNNLNAGTTYTYRVRAYGTTSHSNYSNETSATTGPRTEVEARNDDAQRVPTKLALHQNYPNPFNPRTNIRFDLPHAAHVSLKVFNLMGEEVARLVNETRSAGLHNVVFSAEHLPGGVYFYELRTESQRLTRQLLLVK